MAQPLRRYLQAAAKPVSREVEVDPPPEFVWTGVAHNRHPISACLGRRTAGPPISCQSMEIGASAFPFDAPYQWTETCPSWTESAPCFAALVVNSCNAIETTWPASGLSVTSGPQMSVLLRVAYGASSRRTRSVSEHAMPLPGAQQFVCRRH